ncbi:MAG: LCP family protein [Aerococcaceae bacterium]|nr:LCP family protein [Aerococcaceae bacterium]
MRRSRQNIRRRRKRSGCLPIILISLFVLLLGGTFYVWRAYSSIRDSLDSVYSEKPAEQQMKREQQVQIVDGKKQPFSVLLLGIDTGEYGREGGGRSDVMLVATVNADTKRVTITSIPRDTRTEIVGYGMEDKINHAYAFGGSAMSVNSVQNLLDIPIDYTFTIDMGGFEKVIDAVGGVYITPSSTFNIDGYQFYEGQTMHMDGFTALQYVRFRSDGEGDYGRQKRQRELITAIVKAMVDAETLVSYDAILESLEGVVTMDMTFDEISSVIRNYSSAANNIENYQLSGTGTTIDGVYYDIPDAASIEEISTRIKKELELTQ